MAQLLTIKHFRSFDEEGQKETWGSGGSKMSILYGTSLMDAPLIVSRKLGYRVLIELKFLLKWFKYFWSVSVAWRMCVSFNEIFVSFVAFIWGTRWIRQMSPVMEKPWRRNQPIVCYALLLLLFCNVLYYIFVLFKKIFIAGRTQIFTNNITWG